MTRGRDLAAAALLGAATGMRSGLAVAVVLNAGSSRDRRLKRAFAAYAAGELVYDKLPVAPSRLRPEGLAARVTFAGASAALRTGSAGVPEIVAAAATAPVAAKLTHDVRARRSRVAPPLVVALAEDALAVALVAAAISL